MLIAGAIAGALSKATGQEQMHCNSNRGVSRLTQLAA